MDRQHFFTYFGEFYFTLLVKIQGEMTRGDRVSHREAEGHRKMSGSSISDIN